MRWIRENTGSQYFPAQSDERAVRRFLGLCAYYLLFIRNFSHTAAALTHLTKDDVVFEWAHGQRQAFETLKKALLATPVLGGFDQEVALQMHTDASNRGLGALLVQKQDGTD